MPLKSPRHDSLLTPSLPFGCHPPFIIPLSESPMAFRKGSPLIQVSNSQSAPQNPLRSSYAWFDTGCSIPAPHCRMHCTLLRRYDSAMSLSARLRTSVPSMKVEAALAPFVCHVSLALLLLFVGFTQSRRAPRPDIVTDVNLPALSTSCRGTCRVVTEAHLLQSQC